MRPQIHRTTPVGKGVTQNRQTNEQAEDDNANEVVMAIEMRDRGTVGCCYYVAARETMFLMADIKSAGLDVIDICEPPKIRAGLVH